VEVLDRIDLAELDAEIGKREREHEDHMERLAANTPGGLQRRRCRTGSYAVDEHGKLRGGSASEGDAWDAAMLDGDAVARMVVVQRWVEVGA
jgi:hypothetical protein